MEAVIGSLSHMAFKTDGSKAFKTCFHLMNLTWDDLFDVTSSKHVFVK